VTRLSVACAFVIAACSPSPAPRDANDAPALVVNPSAGDSVDLELADARRETVVVVRGVRTGDSISGAWVVYVSRDAGGRGRFLLRRR
jgi:hypothetical protein